MDPFPKMPLLAPLAEDQVQDLVSHRETMLPRGKGGRPKRGESKIVRYERRLEQALESLIPDVAIARQQVFDLMDPIVGSGQLTRRWLVDILYPPPLTPYPDRLREWREENFLLFDENGNPEPQTTAAILVQKELDVRRRKLPPPRPVPRSFFCWRQDAPGLPPVPYELPLVNVGGATGRPVYKQRPEPGPSPYILSTIWKGVSWDDPDWLVYNEGTIRWVGEPTEDELTRWLSPQGLERLPIQGEALAESRARQALRILADQLRHNADSNTSRTT